MISVAPGTSEMIRIAGIYCLLAICAASTAAERTLLLGVGQTGDRSMAKETLSITDNRTSKTYEVPIEYGVYRDDGAYIRGTELRKIKASGEDFGLLSYDPAFMNTASCQSAITYIDGDKGILRYRGYPIDELAEKS